MSKIGGFFKQAISGDDKGGGIFNKVVDGVTEIVTGVQEGRIAESELQTKLEELKINSNTELEKAYLADIADARNMNATALQSDDKFIRRFIYYLAAVTIILVFTLLILLYFIPIPKGNERIVDMALGSFIGAALSIFIFFYGSTKGSKDKTEIMSNMINKK